jgi:hypothetical protein
VSFQESRLWQEEKLMVIAKLFFSMTCPTNKELFQMTRIPPEAPLEGIKSNLSNLFGVNFLMN